MLIRQGAKLVESAQDILEELRWNRGNLSAPAHNETPQTDSSLQHLLDVAGYDPVSIDQLLQRSDWSVAEVQAGLLTLELNGQMELLPGGQYRRIG